MHRESRGWKSKGWQSGVGVRLRGSYHGLDRDREGEEGCLFIPPYQQVCSPVFVYYLYIIFSVCEMSINIIKRCGGGRVMCCPPRGGCHRKDRGNSPFETSLRESYCDGPSSWYSKLLVRRFCSGGGDGRSSIESVGAHGTLDSAKGGGGPLSTSSSFSGPRSWGAILGSSRGAAVSDMVEVVVGDIDGRSDDKNGR